MWLRVTSESEIMFEVLRQERSVVSRLIERLNAILQNMLIARRLDMSTD